MRRRSLQVRFASVVEVAVAIAVAFFASCGCIVACVDVCAVDARVLAETFSARARQRAFAVLALIIVVGGLLCFFAAIDAGIVFGCRVVACAFAFCAAI